MFEQNSRYYNIETATLTVTDSNRRPRPIRYKRRRFIPSPEGMTTLVEHTVKQGERLDHITARYFNDPTQFWRVCDANGVQNPAELEEVGRVVKISLPQMS